jgi:hypothetical protein
VGSIALGVAVLAGGCSTLQVKSTAAPGANLAAYRTFAFLPPGASSSGAALLATSPAGQEIQGSIAQSLQAKGYVPAQAGQQPDVLIAYNRVLQNKLEVEDWGYAGPFWGGWPGAVTQYTEGTIVVDIIDARTRQVLWRGTASQVVNDPLNPDPQKVHNAIAKLMQTYPTQAASASAGAQMPGRM